MATIALKRDGDAIILIGKTKGHLGQSLYLREIENLELGAAPPVDLAAERKNGDCVRDLVQSGTLDTAHDISDGGLLVALAEMAMAGEKGVRVSLPSGCQAIPFLFGEDQSRYILATARENADAVLKRAEATDVPASLLGYVGGDTIELAGLGALKVSTLRRAHEGWFPNYMGAEELPPTN
jgi:phosphoribosylformylglycinamidine synthase